MKLVFCTNNYFMKNILSNSDYLIEYKCGSTHYSISRADYECMCPPMNTSNLSDMDMNALANEIGKHLQNKYKFTEEFKEITDKTSKQYWDVVKTIGIRFGVIYYEKN